MQNNEYQKDVSQNPGERLLDAAEKLFCERGYDGTSVRDITNEAGCNIAAVNYHFGGKEQLYQEMFRRRMARNMKSHYETIERICSAPSPTLEDLLSELVRPIVESAEQQDPWAKVVRLMVREALNQRLEMDKIAGDMKELFFDRLARAFMQIIPEMDLRTARQAVFSIDALVLHPILFMEHYFYFMNDLTPEEIIEQIVQFGAAGIRSMTQSDKS